MRVYDQATKAVPASEKLSMYQIYIARAGEIFGVPKTREIYEQAIESGLPDKDAKTMCIKYAELEKSFGEIDRTRGIYKHASEFPDPRSDADFADFWSEWHDLRCNMVMKILSGRCYVLKGVLLLSIVRHIILPEYMMQKDLKSNPEEAMDSQMKNGIAGDNMAALERQLVPPASDAAKDSTRKLGFVSAGVESQTDGGLKIAANKEDIELPDERNVQITQKDIPEAVYGGVRKRGDEDVDAKDSKDGESHLGALEQLKRMRRGG